MLLSSQTQGHVGVDLVFLSLLAEDMTPHGCCKNELVEHFFYVFRF